MVGLAKAIFTCVYNEYRSIDLASYGGKIIGYRSTGNLPTANSYINGAGIPNSVTIWTYGYVT